MKVRTYWKVTTRGGAVKPIFDREELDEICDKGVAKVQYKEEWGEWYECEEEVVRVERITIEELYSKD